MPSTISSSVAMPCESSTVITPSWPTLSMASAMSSPMTSSTEDMAATLATSSWPLTGVDRRLTSATTAATAVSIPLLSSMGSAPAVRLRNPSWIIACASRVAVVVPSPATSLVLAATSRSKRAPTFSTGSSSSMSLAIVTPSLITRGSPNLRPAGPRVTFTASASASMPRFIACRASVSKSIDLAMIRSSGLTYVWSSSAQRRGLVGGGRTGQVQQAVHALDPRDATDRRFDEANVIAIFDLAAQGDDALLRLHGEVALGDVEIGEDLALDPVDEGDVVGRLIHAEMVCSLAYPIGHPLDVAEPVDQVSTGTAEGPTNHLLGVDPAGPSPVRVYEVLDDRAQRGDLDEAHELSQSIDR